MSGESTYRIGPLYRNHPKRENPNSSVGEHRRPLRCSSGWMAGLPTASTVPSAARACIGRLLEQERPVHPDSTYLHPGAHHRVRERHRHKVVRYINEVAEEFGLLVQTGGLACNYFDRYLATLLSFSSVTSRDMQMVASTCLLIAAKFLEGKMLLLSELSQVHNCEVRPTDFAVLETSILTTLKWDLHVPMPHAFIDLLRATLPSTLIDPRVHECLHFFIDLSVYDYALLIYSPAEICAGALLAAWKFSQNDAAVEAQLPALAYNCWTGQERLLACANGLVQDCQACFPDTVDSSKLLLRIPDEPKVVQQTPRGSPKSVLDS